MSLALKQKPRFAVVSIEGNFAMMISLHEPKTPFYLRALEQQGQNTGPRVAKFNAE
jgi:hypothetical protein